MRDELLVQISDLDKSKKKGHKKRIRVGGRDHEFAFRYVLFEVPLRYLSVGG